MWNSDAVPREDVRQSIERAWPEGVVEMVFHSDESYFWDIYPKLRTAIQRLKGARLVHERVPDGGPTWFDDSDPEEDPADGEVRPRSRAIPSHERPPVVTIRPWSRSGRGDRQAVGTGKPRSGEAAVRVKGRSW